MITKKPIAMVLTFRFYPGLWWAFCDKHLKQLTRECKKIGYGEAYAKNRKCDIPFCKNKRLWEYYPSHRHNWSLNVPEKGTK